MADDEVDVEAVAALRKKRQFRKFTFRGLELERLLDLSHEELLGFVTARARRRMQRGLKRKPMALIKKLRKAKAGKMFPDKSYKCHPFFKIPTVSSILHVNIRRGQPRLIENYLHRIDTTWNQYFVDKLQKQLENVRQTYTTLTGVLSVNNEICLFINTSLCSVLEPILCNSLPLIAYYSLLIILHNLLTFPQNLSTIFYNCVTIFHNSSQY